MKTTNRSNAACVQEIRRGLARVGDFRRTLNNILTEVANGSRRLPVSVYEGEGNTMTYRITHRGVTFTLHVQEEGAAQ